jgi:hypothetical protein
MTKPLFAALLLATACATTPAGKDPMTELRALDAQGGYTELWDTLSTVPPSERNAEWLGLAEKAGIAKLGLVKGEGEGALTLADEMLVRFPTLKTSKAFMDKRFELALTGFAGSYGSSRHSSGDDPWLTRVRAFGTNEARPDAPRRVAKEVILKRLIPITAFPLVKLAIEREGKAVCGDAELRQSVIDAVEEKSWLEESKALITGTCAAELRPAVVAAISAEKASYAMKKNGCALLKSLGGADAPAVCSAAP